MEQEKIIILDEDERFCTLLAYYINEKAHTGMRAEPFTDPEYLSEYLNKSAADILLINASLMDRVLLPEREAPFVIALVEEEPEEEMRVPWVLKYQAAATLTNAVIEAYAKRGRAGEIHPPLPGEDAPSGEEMMPGKDTLPGEVPAAGPALAMPDAKLIAVYSPIGRCGKTSFAVTLGEMMAFHQKVLYVNLEDYSGFSELLGDLPEGDLSDLMYVSRLEEGEILYKLSGIIRTWERLDYIPPVFSMNDLRELSAKEWVSLLGKIASDGEYDRIILDIGTQIDNVWEILKLCVRIYVPVLNDPAAKAKLIQFGAETERFGGSALLEKLKYLHLPEPGKEERSERLPFPERIVRGRMGDYVKRLLRSQEKEVL